MNDEPQCYHEGQRGEEEADDQFEVRPVTHHHGQALTEGEELRFFPPPLWNPKIRRKLESLQRFH